MEDLEAGSADYDLDLAHLFHGMRDFFRFLALLLVLSLCTNVLRDGVIGIEASEVVRVSFEIVLGSGP